MGKNNKRRIDKFENEPDPFDALPQIEEQKEPGIAVPKTATTEAELKLAKLQILENRRLRELEAQKEDSDDFDNDKMFAHKKQKHQAHRNNQQQGKNEKYRGGRPKKIKDKSSTTATSTNTNNSSGQNN